MNRICPACREPFVPEVRVQEKCDGCAMEENDAIYRQQQDYLAARAEEAADRAAWHLSWNAA